MLTYDPMELAWDRFLKQDNNTLLDFFKDIIGNWGDWEGKFKPQYVDIDVPLIDPKSSKVTLYIMNVLPRAESFKVHTLKKIVKNKLEKIELYKEWQKLQNSEVQETTSSIQEGKTQEGLAGLGILGELKELEKKLGFDDEKLRDNREKSIETDIKNEDKLKKDLEYLESQKGGKVDLKREFEKLLTWSEFENKLKVEQKSEGHRVNLKKIVRILEKLSVERELNKAKEYFIESISDYTGKLQGVADISGQLKGWRTKLTKLYEWVRDFKGAISSPKAKETYFRGDEQFDSRQNAINKVINQLDDKLELDSFMRLWRKDEKRFSKERFSNMANKENNIHKKNKLESIALALGQEGNRELLKSEEKILKLLQSTYTGDEEQYKGKTYLEILQFEFGQRGKPFIHSKMTPKGMEKEHYTKKKLNEENIIYDLWRPTLKEFSKESVKSRFEDWVGVSLKELLNIRKLESIIAFLKLNNKDVEGYSDKERDREKLEKEIDDEYVKILEDKWGSEKPTPTPKTESDEPKNPFKVRQ
tara:strand:+ start:1326 stop:2918 length:1593 start_codon:yes stop_codon:yes gene_type:complete